MSGNTRNILLAAGGCVVVGVCLVLGAFVATFVLGLFASGGRQDGVRLSSPDGSKVLVTSVNNSQADPTRYLTLNIEIRDAATDTLLFAEQTGASSRLAWNVRWLSNTEIQLDSSDIGSYCWEEQSAGSWASVTCP